MRRFFYFLILPCLVNCSNRGLPIIDDHCVVTHKSTEDIKQIFPFSKCSVIKMISFKPREMPDNRSQLIFEIPKSNSEIDTTKLFEIKTLNRVQEAELLNILMNYNFSRKTKAISSTRSACIYSPRNAILFCEGSGKVIAYIEICFECSIFELSPNAQFPKNLTVGEFCKGKWTMVKDAFQKIGIDYGTYAD